MGLGAGQDPSILEVANLAAEKAFRMVVDSLEIDRATGVVRVQGTGPGGAPIQATHLDLAFPFGHYSLPPADVEGVAVPGAVKAVVVATRDPALPADLRPLGSQAMAVGESVTYSRGGVYAKKGGSKGRLGKSGSPAAAAAVARKLDGCRSSKDFGAWAANVEAALAGPPATPIAVTWLAQGNHIADINDATGLIVGAVSAGSPNWDCA